MTFTMKVKDFHSMDGHAARQSGRLSMMKVTIETSVIPFFSKVKAKLALI